MTRVVPFLAAILLLLAAKGVAAAEPGEAVPQAANAEPAPDPAATFHTRLLPLLRAKCLGCHGEGNDLEGEYDMRTRAGLLAGGELGTAVVPGKPEESPAYQAVLRTGERAMPPQERNKLSPEEVELFRAWIAAGAPWPAEPAAGDSWNEAEEIALATSGGLSPEWTARRYPRESVWAWFPPEPAEPPHEALPAGARRHPVDAFLAKKMNEAGVEPAPPAERLTWLRRATFSLTGLAPTPEEIAEYLAEPSPAAEQRVIERLLASPRYGERMAQHWLDVVRYADTDGFSNDYERPQAWRYRDYVIRAFNDDKPYDRFILEQIAGDELEPENPELRLATGFLRMGPWEHTAMSVAAVTRQLWLDDVTNSVGLTFLAQGMSCCQCHDHKFDPLPTRDYYRLQAVFAATVFDQPPAERLARENLPGWPELRRAAERQLAPEGLISKMQLDDDNVFGRIQKKRNEYLQRALARDAELAFAVKTGNPETVHVLTGGALDSPGELVEPGALSAMRGIDPAAAEIPTEAAGRRLALARWIAHPRNTLTPRVLVNRVWQMHFGRGLVATPNNFGRMGARPTHPELLDWLALRFVEEGWSVKQLHRLLMTSAAYARGTRHLQEEQRRRLDPKNELWAVFVPRRLSAEEVRDAMLQVSGELSPAAGGPPVFPEINAEVALQPRHIMGGIAPAYQASPTPELRNRRTIYAARIRTLGDPLLEVLNRPGPDLSCERREESTIAPQAFTLLNSRFTQARALALAHRLADEAETLEGRIARAFALLYGREPSPEEAARCAAHVAHMETLHARHAPAPVERPRMVQRQMIAEQSGELFHWEEQLEVDHHQADRAPADSPPPLRALAELCLVLLNSSEFLYVY